MRPPDVFISGAVEGLVDEAVISRLIRHVHAEAASIHIAYGKEKLRDSVRGFNNAARFSPWLVLVDLDQDADCAPPFVQAWLPHSAPAMCFRVVVRAIEAWLLADKERIASFLRVPPHDIPSDPESLSDPKRAMVDLARRSRREAVQADMVPRPRSGRPVGPAYTSRLVEFATDQRHGWRPAVAAGSADSLSRCLRALRRLKWIRRSTRGTGNY